MKITRICFLLSLVCANPAFAERVIARVFVDDVLYQYPNIQKYVELSGDTSERYMKFLVRDDGILPDLSGLVTNLRDKGISFSENYYYDSNGIQKEDRLYSEQVDGGIINLSSTATTVDLNIVDVAKTDIIDECIRLGGTYNGATCTPPNNKTFVIERFDPNNGYAPVFGMVDTETMLKDYKTLCSSFGVGWRKDYTFGLEFCYCGEGLFWDSRFGCAINPELEIGGKNMANFYCDGTLDVETNSCHCNTVNNYGVEERRITGRTWYCETCSSKNAIYVPNVGLYGACQTCPDKVDVEHNTCVTSCQNNQKYIDTMVEEYSHHYPNPHLCVPLSDTERCLAHDDAKVSESGNLCIIYGIGEDECRTIAVQDGGVFWKYFTKSDGLEVRGITTTDTHCLYIPSSVYKKMSAVCRQLGGVPDNLNCINITNIPPEYTSCEEYVSSVYTEWPATDCNTITESGNTKYSFGFLQIMDDTGRVYVGNDLRGTCSYPGMEPRPDTGNCRCPEGQGIDFRLSNAYTIGCQQCDSDPAIATKFFFYGCGGPFSY